MLNPDSDSDAKNCFPTMDSSRSVTHHPSLIPNHVLGFGLVLLILLPIYLLTLQTQINGAEHYFMIDVGETQAVLNVWGTLHATGYPLYVMVSSGLVALLRDVFGLSAAAAPAIGGSGSCRDLIDLRGDGAGVVLCAGHSGFGYQLPATGFY